MEENSTSKSLQGLNTRSTVILVAGVVLLVALLTNPSLDQHKSAVKIVAGKVVGEATQELEKEENPFAALGAAMGSVMINSLVESIVSSQNYLVFSLTRITFEGESRTVGIGAFGNVFLFDKNLDPESLKSRL
ncbi:hypothetical protein DYBT9623_00695 [Dyadobacter sp. CECT 9623]|uniref:DUF4359 domain-containing protein n=1 Tax=Dyadobacter linearis TaxID=2823330 RepID=A0ABM8UKS6_9BACT|nr:DUF4359 domain-containing protein [Dyadobacter sp. CECT 9623]CAG5067967.1 hypothetical protein DYBT9623_00695 [Dyadobacter sp. CECT 9623]